MGCPTALSSLLASGSTTTLATGKGTLNGVLVQPGGVVTVYDNTAASGKVVFLYNNAGTSTASVVFYNAIRCDIGMTVTSAAADCIIYYGA